MTLWTSQLPPSVKIVEVGPRDGLQNEARQLPTECKRELIERLITAGLKDIEICSFVSTKKIPQFADSAALCSALLAQPRPDIHFSALVPNIQGLDDALAAGLKEVSFFTTVSATFCEKNIHCSIEESIERLRTFMPVAKRNGLKVRAYISCVLGCPYEGFMPYQHTAELGQRLLDLGCYELSLGDTIGIGTPRTVSDLLDCLMKTIPASRLAVHFHDTYGQAIANIVMALQYGMATIDAAVGGLGGCPYARGASGNVATEDLVYLLEGLGIPTGIDLMKLSETGEWISQECGHHTRSKVGKALLKAG